MYLNHNSHHLYRFALCIPPDASGIMLLQPFIKVDPQLLHIANVRFGVVAGMQTLQSIEVSSASAQLSIGIADSFFGGDGGRVEVTLEAVFKNDSQPVSNERIAIRLVMTCNYMPPPPSPFRTPDMHAPPDPPVDAVASLLEEANGCITPSCLRRTYLKYQTSALKYLQTKFACDQATTPTPECSHAAHTATNASAINFLIFRPIPGNGWGNSALLLMEAAQLALADWRVLLIDTPHYEHIASQLSGPFVVSNQNARLRCAAAGAPLHAGVHLRNYGQQSAGGASSTKHRARVVVVEILDDSPLYWQGVLVDAKMLLFPRALDILPPFLYARAHAPPPPVVLL